MLSHCVAGSAHRATWRTFTASRACAFSLPTMETSNPRKHRPRSQPTPSGRQYLITDNDIFGIFEPLSRHAQLTTKQIVAFDRRHASNTRNRLTDLYHEEGEWLVRLSETLKLANSLFIDEMYRLGEDAEDLLKVRGIIPSDNWVRATRVGGNSTAPSRIFRLAHDHMASQIALDIEIGARDGEARSLSQPHRDHQRRAGAHAEHFPNPCASSCRRSLARRNGSSRTRSSRIDDRILRDRSRHRLREHRGRHQTENQSLSRDRCVRHDRRSFRHRQSPRAFSSRRTRSACAT